VRAHSGGFTLLETVVSLSILAVVAGILAVTFRLASGSIERGEAETLETARLRAGIGILQRTIRSADIALVPAGEQKSPYFVGERNRVRFLSTVPVSSASGAGFRLVCLREAVEVSGGGIAISDASPFRLEGADRWEGTGTFRVLLPGASEVRFAYSPGPDPGGSWEWSESWDAVVEGRLPGAVRVEFVVTGKDGAAEKTAFVVPVFAGT